MYAALPFLLCGLCLIPGGMAQSSNFDYCQAGLCPRVKRHIACNDKGIFGIQCPMNATELLNLTDYQGMILGEHNALRNGLAAGKIDNVLLLPIPDRMATLQWHPELEYLATVSVRHCALHHEPCLNTRDFLNSGQNMALIHVNSSLPADSRTDEVLIKVAIGQWWSQIANVTAEQVQKFPKAKLRVSIRNFAVMARDNNTFVGCAALRYVRRQVEHNFLLACNYASNYAPNQPIYRQKALGCQTGTDSKYPSLCRTGEQYDDVAALMESTTKQGQLWG